MPSVELPDDVTRPSPRLNLVEPAAPESVGNTNLRLAVENDDLFRISKEMRNGLVSCLDLREGKGSGVKVGDAKDVVVLPFRSDTAEELILAASCCDVVRNADKENGRSPTAVWVFKKMAWTKVAGNVTLTIVVDRSPGNGNGKRLVLNPAVFGNRVVEKPAINPIGGEPPKRDAGERIIVKRRWGDKI